MGDYQVKGRSIAVQGDGLNSYISTINTSPDYESKGESLKEVL
jgi:hypothetical protein